MLQIAMNDNFESWRGKVRMLLSDRVHPEEVIWTPKDQGTLFEDACSNETCLEQIRVPSQFLKFAKVVACFDDFAKWKLLYRLLFRLKFEERDLLEIASDSDTLSARLMEKAVRRDIHKFHAFVRFRRIECEGEDVFGAWHEPQHFTVEMAAPFFARRFGSMKFSIFTPKGCAHWDTRSLRFSQAADRNAAPSSDEMEEFWLLYYKSIFNPFRLKIKAMKKEFPKRHWRTLPEAILIPELIRQAKEID